MAIFTGETVEDAIDRGLNRLGVKRENVHIHIEQKEKKGFLGFGKKRARVNIEPIHEETVRKADHLAERGVDDTINLGVPKSQSAMEATLELSQVVKAVRAAEREQNGEITEEERNAIIEVAKKKVVQNRQGTTDFSDVVAAVKEEVEAKKEVSNEEEKIASKISSYLTTITQEMGIATRVSVSRDGNLTVFNLTSNHDALLIGKHGKILQSLQILAKAYANSILNTRMNVAVNVGDYHEKRKAYIVSLAHRAAERARGGETVYINDLQSNERKIVHTIIGQENGVSSHSEGQEYNRYIVVSKEI
ncbi:RNA-binding cell elongation regulator Jag/EloR [Lactococcus cremoris]|uniref:RNA-binding cell elongation regulator Jag/EloR n=1 Tax=Lactococcus lactis subsp. cremoris TaxID=1359 RepID=UPI00038B6AA7|nr:MULTISPECIES: RNA-binding cell elongation regulator Jag/EloR [Lactococcus]EQC56230.1 RNA-binding protein [Lactococcus cremoris subsp. cremoris TIFN5]EQC84852.1 RNA-binding protein [Lactococcus cremoris subsp. cremoris TIFN1]ARE17234.1 RNA-binding cell elongation regulator Jag/EloR [Lactococcus cremoris]ARE24982.1 RNA-binding cell elongation regulator Jag/EloR [Lactococcus cremoris]AXN64387.1 RNA-binding protein [Lactococcus cremoris]